MALRMRNGITHAQWHYACAMALRMRNGITHAQCDILYYAVKVEVLVNYLMLCIVLIIAVL